MPRASAGAAGREVSESPARLGARPRVGLRVPLGLVVQSDVLFSGNVKNVSSLGKKICKRLGKLKRPSLACTSPG